ncbi:hypothetical protein CsatB_023543 [Cannabis sativa]
MEGGAHRQWTPNGGEACLPLQPQYSTHAQLLRLRVQFLVLRQPSQHRPPLPHFPSVGLEVMQSHHIAHRDLKPENILLSSTEGDPVLKMADFGLSRCIHPGDYAETVCGSQLYMAPEVLAFQRYDERAFVESWCNPF